MSMETFIKACKLVENRGEGIFLGGGEPTLHPLFSQFLGIALMSNNYDNECQVGIITNGSNTDISIKLASMAKAGIIYAGLSQDKFHDEIDERVVKAFTKDKSVYDPYNRDSRDIRRIYDNSVIGVGRAKKLKGIKKIDDCICLELFIDPEGNIFHCGCKLVSFGTLDNIKIPDDYMSYTCSNDNDE